jgi:CDP-diacylglycerol--serine O-phosphatidyltransferase
MSFKLHAEPDDSAAEDRAQRRIQRLEAKQHRRLRLRRHGRRAYIRSVYFLPSMATLGNAICGFGAMYVAALPPGTGADNFTLFFANHRFTVAAYLIFLAMVCDALDGRLARFARHTTDFGGQLDSLADVISFGAAPAFVSLLVFKADFVNQHAQDLPLAISRLIWSVGAIYMSCAALRLARFNVSNEHGEQHHFSFLGLPSPAAGGTVAAWILMQQELSHSADKLAHLPQWLATLVGDLSTTCIVILPLIVLGTGLLMISHIRYPHLVNRYLRGRRSISRLIIVLMGLLLLIVAHEYVMAVGMLTYVLWGTLSAATRWWRMKV